MYESDFSIVLAYLPFLLRGIEMTFLVSLAAIVFSMTVGLLLALIRLSRLRAANAAAALYIDFFRSTPPLVHLVWMYFVLPVLTGIKLGALFTGILALGLYMASYMAEIYRAGILSVEQGQWRASKALGMTTQQMMRRVVLPQAVVRMIPPFASMFVSLVKDSALVSTIGIQDLMRQGLALSAFTLRPFESITVTALLYLVITYPLTVAANKLHQRFLTH